MKNDRRLIISFAINILVFLLFVAGTIIMFTVGSGALTSKGFTVFKYFTFQSNIFMGAVAFIYGYYQWLILRKKIDKIPHVLGVFNHIAVTAVGLTFIIVILVLGPGYGYDKMYNNANLFFHALVPILAIVNYLFFEKETKIRFKETLYAMIPCTLYGIVYFIVVVSQNAYGNLAIDFYNFGKDGPFIGALYFLAIIAISYIFGLFLYFINQLVFKKRA